MTGRVGNRKTNGDHENNSIVDIGQNNNKSPGDLSRFAVTQTLVKEHQLMPMWGALKRIIIIIWFRKTLIIECL